MEGHAPGLNAGSRALTGAETSGNAFSGNSIGLSAGPRDTVISDNLFSSNSRCGLLLTAGQNTADASYGASGCRVENNVFQSNGTAPHPGGVGDIVTDDQADGTQASNEFHCNHFKSAVAIFNNEPSLGIHAADNFWNAIDDPAGSASGSGSAISGVGNVIYQPFYADQDFKQLVFGNAPLVGTLMLADGESISGPELTIAPLGELVLSTGSSVQVDTMLLQAGATIKATYGTIQTGKLTLQPGAVLDIIIGGALSLDPLASGNFHTIAGSFTFFDSLGSLDIHADTTFSGSTLGLASNIHVAPGVILTVSGSLGLDGCLLDGSAPFEMRVDPTGSLDVLRCDVTGCEFQIHSGNVRILDNRFTDSTLTMAATVRGAEIYPNVVYGSSALDVLPGASVTTHVEGWGNVSSAGAVENARSLVFRAPLNPTRTLDAAGNLFVQPGDLLDVGLDVSNLNLKAQAVELLLGYYTDHLTLVSLLPSSDWTNRLYEASDSAAAIGRFNTAIGLNFAFPDPDGSTADSAVPEIRLLAKALEGRTRFFFRMKSPVDEPLPETRITGSSAGAPVLKQNPFTRDTAELTVDGPAPSFAMGASAMQIRDAGPIDLLQSGNQTAQGLVTVTFDATDALAGVIDTAVHATLTGPTTVAGVLSGTSQIVLSSITHTRYVFSFSVTGATPNGIYNVDAAVIDRAGNSAALVIGSLEINTNCIAATVQPQALVATPLPRDVVFTATDISGATLASWTRPVLFNGGLGSTDLDLVLSGTYRLSTKMAWNTRIRLPVALDGNGQGMVSFTGVPQLPGGDFKGDNVINVGDYNIMRSFFPRVNPQTDITGNGISNVGDSNVLRSNWLTSVNPL